MHQSYFLEVCEVKPNNAACIIETDVFLDFEAPVGYVEKFVPKAGKVDEKAVAAPAPVIARTLQKASTEPSEADNEFKPFVGSAQRIDGKQATVATATLATAATKDAPHVAASAAAAAITTTVPRQSLLSNNFSKKKASTTFFGGTGQSLGHISK